MTRLFLHGVAAAALVACTPAAPPKSYPAETEGKAVLVFNTGDAPAGAFDSFGAALAKRGVSVVLATGRTWRSEATKAMSPASCTQVGGYGAAVDPVAAFAVANFNKGVDNALLIGGLIGTGRNFLRSPVAVSNVIADKDPATPQSAVSLALTRYPDLSSWTTFNDADRGAFFATATPEQREALVNVAEYEILQRCRKRIDRIQQAAQQKEWDEARKQAKAAPH